LTLIVTSEVTTVFRTNVLHSDVNSCSPEGATKVSTFYALWLFFLTLYS